jgi:putative membrane protein
MGDGWGWWMALDSVWMLAFWGLIAWAIYALVRRPGDREQIPGGGPNALEILDQRYARGELSDEQHAAMRRPLQRPSGT